MSDNARPQSPARMKHAGWILLVALWFAVMTGFTESAILLGRKYILGRYLFWGPDTVWLRPLAYTLLFSGPAIGLALVATAWPKARSRRLVVFVLALLSFGSLVVGVRGLYPLAKALVALGLAVQTARMVEARPDGFTRLVRRSVIALVMTIALLAAAMQSVPRLGERAAIARLVPTRADVPNILLIVLDTVRAANLSLHGYERPTTPFLEQIALQSVVFDRAIATSPWTLPTHASLFTGRVPSELGVGYENSLDGTYPTLAEHLQAAGYVTAGIVANVHYGSAETGLNRGFIRYEDYQPFYDRLWNHTWLAQSYSARRLVRARSLGSMVAALRPQQWSVRPVPWVRPRPAEEITDAFLRWHAGVDRPFFAFINYFDAHAPYRSPQPSRFGGGVKRVDLYDAAIAYVDEQVERLLHGLDERGALDNTVVIITSDHGEQFGEHNLTTHGNSLYTQLLHVPLLIRYPARVPAGGRVGHSVGLLDLPRTILDLAGVPGKGAMPGTSLARHWTEPAGPDERTGSGGMGGGGGELILSELTWDNKPTSVDLVDKGQMKSLVDGTAHYIWGYTSDGQTQEQLFDLAADPHEEHDLWESQSHRAVRERLSATLQAMFPPRRPLAVGSQGRSLAPSGASLP